MQCERDKWERQLQEKPPKLRTYITLKSEYATEKYVDIVSFPTHGSFLACLRGGTAPLEMEKGRLYPAYGRENL